MTRNMKKTMLMIVLLVVAHVGAFAQLRGQEI